METKLENFLYLCVGLGIGYSASVKSGVGMVLGGLILFVLEGRYARNVEDDNEQ